MAKRVTITFGDDLHRRIRECQVRTMLERNRAYSFSEAVNDLLARDSSDGRSRVPSSARGEGDVAEWTRPGGRRGV